MNATPASLTRQIACVRREIALRKVAYPRWVAQERMKQTAADDEIAAMEAVLDTLNYIANLPDPPH